MELGNFSISLTVKDIEASKQFYEKFGFQAMMGDQAQGWLILKNDLHVIGLFQGMFERNILTFNPGWDNNAQEARVVHRRATCNASQVARRPAGD
jgi:predicted lactoylglutathione lyase